MIDKESVSYKCWLNHESLKKSPYLEFFKNIVSSSEGIMITSAINEIKRAIRCENGYVCKVFKSEGYLNNEKYIHLKIEDNSEIENDGYKIYKEKMKIVVQSINENGILYGVFALLRILEMERSLERPIVENPKTALRLINHWDNIDGTVERGYAGASILFESARNKEITKEIMELLGNNASNEIVRRAMNDNYQLASDIDRIDDYARILASIGINSIVLNNTNVHLDETKFIDEKINIIQELQSVFNNYGIKVYISINFAAPITLNELSTCDPLNEEVQKWWQEKIDYVYSKLPGLGGFMVKADSEGRPGPFTYKRNHADGANMFARELKKHHGKLIWRCFVYNCKQDWRDKETDRAKAAYDCFKELDGKFLDNVYLQIKNGPMDFQVREPVSPLLGDIDNTNKILELQITQEYTGHQKDVCFLVPWWKEVLSFDTFAGGDKSLVKDRIAGIAGIANIGNDENWTGNFLAQANLYGYGRLAWNSDISSDEIIDEWISMTLGRNEMVLDNISYILKNSWKAYEDYTAPLGIGWMVTPGLHYGCDVDGYEYSPWGTYNRADCHGIGIDRSMETGTAYVRQYKEPLCTIYNDPKKCPDELKLFFHHLPYDFTLNNGQTIIQYIYTTHFRGEEEVEKFIEMWIKLNGIIPKNIYDSTLQLLKVQRENAIDWRDKINSYFYRLSGIKDEKNRLIY